MLNEDNIIMPKEKIQKMGDFIFKLQVIKLLFAFTWNT